jgi:hypothetical protein
MPGENDRERGSVHCSPNYRTTSSGGIQNGLLWRNDILTRWTLRPNAFCPIVSLVFNQYPRSRDALIAVWTATGTLRVIRHGKEMDGACDSVPSRQNSTVLENKCLPSLQVQKTKVKSSWIIPVIVVPATTGTVRRRTRDW